MAGKFFTYCWDACNQSVCGGRGGGGGGGSLRLAPINKVKLMCTFLSRRLKSLRCFAHFDRVRGWFDKDYNDPEGFTVSTCIIARDGFNVAGLSRALVTAPRQLLSAEKLGWSLK